LFNCAENNRAYVPNSQDACTSIRMDRASAGRRFAQGSAQEAISGLRFDGDERMEVAALKILSQAIFVNGFNLLHQIRGAHRQCPLPFM
jgi:hypothetical protein